MNEEKSVQRQDSRVLSSLLSQVELTSSSISTSIDSMYVEVSKLADGNEFPAKISSMQFTVQKIDDKSDLVFNNLVNQILEYLPDNEVEERESLRKQFILREKARIDKLYILLASKVKDMSFVASGPTPLEKREQTFLKKVDPPKWGGDPIEFAEF